MKKSLLAVMLLFLVYQHLLRAQIWQQNTPDSVRLKIVFPVDGDTLSFERVRYAGSTLPDTRVWVQGIETRVYPSGAFVGLVDLEPGFNSIIFTVRDTLGMVSEIVNVIRKEPVFAYPETPTTIALKSIQPDEDVYLSPGDLLNVEFQGSPMGKATFSINKIVKNVNTIETSQDSIRGFYEGVVRIPEINDFNPKPVEFKFKGLDGHELEFESKGKIHLLSPAIAYIGVTVDTINTVLTKPNGQVWMELPVGIKMQIIGEQNGFKKVRIAENRVGYIDTRRLLTLPEGTPFPEATIGSIVTVRNDDWLQIRVNLTERVPFSIEQIVEPPALEISFYRAHQEPQWISYPPTAETINMIQLQQVTGEIFVLRVDLRQKQQWGYRGRYVGEQFWLDIRKTPVFSYDSKVPLRGLSIAVDPGHGGEFEGAVGATGLQEKTVNLEVALRVAQLLKSAGARVVMTRTQDTTVTLPERVKIAEEANAHIFLSLHSNSISPPTDPLRPRGVSIYYSVPQSQEITTFIYQRLLNLGIPPFGRVATTFFVTRQTAMLSTLIEGAFLSHPEDEMLLLDDKFLDDLAMAIVEGIKDFVNEQMNGFQRAETNGAIRSH